MIEFQLSVEDKATIFDEACRRQAVNEKRKLRGRNGAPSRGGGSLGLHLLGATGELVVARILSVDHLLFADNVPRRGSSDLANIEVKTRSNHKYDLLIQLDDDRHKSFVLVTMAEERIFVHGWIPGDEAMEEKRIREYAQGRPCYAVPQEALRPIGELLDQFASFC